MHSAARTLDAVISHLRRSRHRFSVCRQLSGRSGRSAQANPDIASPSLGKFQSPSCRILGGPSFARTSRKHLSLRPPKTYELSNLATNNRSDTLAPSPYGVDVVVVFVGWISFVCFCFVFTDGALLLLLLCFAGAFWYTIVVHRFFTC